ncbi:Serine/threonine-protein kinase PknD [Rubripirellula tenax]|uniref:Serine/threonine-protein kinase PknD n=1 Tax=Rubripirellula tenax TaxID=2528015 RepID=A0A5C6F8L3_9BACT|nr:PAS domain S-box protein [Rubripirellula tenax]TWU56456.1 Serine/threonine-protein kinase PknD [Rubripirellula tenax]
MNVETHLTQEQLQRWVRQELAEADEELVERHLQTCDDCALLIDDLEIEIDPFVDVLRVSASAASDTVSAGFLTQFAHESGDSAAAERRSLSSSARWQPELLLASGGIGEVWVALDLLLGRTVALKKLKQETAGIPSIQRRFLTEARITAQINHPGTVTVMDLVDDGPDSFYVMTLVQGKSLAELIQRAHREQPASKEFDSSMSQLVRHWIMVARTIAYAHTKSVLHRDIKSENVIVGEYGQVTVIDWGLAKRMDARDEESEAIEPTLPAQNSPLATRPGIRLGTPCFMAPEQALGENASIDEQTDVWGLGAMLYEILSGAPPFYGSTPEQVIRAVVHQPIPRLNLSFPSLPMGLCELCASALHKDKTLRTTTAKELADSVEKWLNAHAVQQQSTAARQKLFELSDDIMLIFDGTPKVIWANAAWESVLGWDPDSLIGTLPNSLVHPDDVNADDEVYEKLERGETASGIERRTQARDGSYRWFSWTATPIAGEQSICAIGRDIHDQRQRSADYESLLNSAPDATLVVDGDRVIRMVNQQMIELFGYREEELLGQKIEILLPERFRQSHPQHVANYMRQPSVQKMADRDGLIGLHKSGAEFPVAIRLSPVQLQSALHFVASIRTIN